MSHAEVTFETGKPEQGVSIMMTKRRAGMFAVGRGTRRAVDLRAGPAGARRRGSGSAYDPAKAGDKTLTVWWLGNQEVPGIEDWMAEAVAAYQKRNTRTSP